MRALRKLSALALALTTLAFARAAAADDGKSATATATAAAARPWVDRPLTLPPLHFSADVGVGFGLFEESQPDPNNPAQTIDLGTKTGWGSSLEAAVGLPFVGELGLRLGYRFGPQVSTGGTETVPAGVAAGAYGADHFGRLFDPVASDSGSADFTNPEIRARNTLLNAQVFELGLEARAILPTAANSNFGLTPAAPMRVHLPGLLRIDTGIYLPITFNGATSFTLDVPVQAYLQFHDAFVGPATGIRYNQPGGGDASTAEIPLGLAGGYTLGGSFGAVDLKVQVRTERINDANSWQYFGAGLGVGLRVP
jgi:hypothetical protein